MKRVALAAGLVFGARVAVADTPEGYIGKPKPILEIDNCTATPDGMTDAEKVKLGEERYLRGETLYIQGDYKGAISEFVGSYCLVGYYTILKDIGQAYERDLQYEKAVAYLEKYVLAIKPEYKRASACAPDPQVDRENVDRRIFVLNRLRAQVSVQTNPSDATITLQNDTGLAARGVSGQTLKVPGATYEMVIERPGYEKRIESITVQIGQPYTYFYTLEPERGQLSITTTPADARIFINDRFAGIGRVEEAVKSDAYTLLVEAPGREEVEQRVEVIANEINRVQIDLALRPQFGRRQLYIAMGIGGAGVISSLTAPFDEATVQGAGTLIGVTAGLVGGWLFLPEQVPLGTSNLTITSGLAGMVFGLAGSLVFTDSEDVVQAATGAGTVAGAVTGYYLGDRVKISTGDAAIINTGATWGTVSGLLFSLSFDADRRIGSGLVLSGLGMGMAGGALLSSYFDISRTHAALIDLGGVLGVVGGLAAVGLVYPSSDSSERQQEHLANFALGGMAVGLLGAGLLTRNIDTPKIPVAPTLGATTDAAGTSTTTFGVGGAW